MYASSTMLSTLSPALHLLGLGGCLRRVARCSEENSTNINIKSLIDEMKETRQVSHYYNTNDKQST